MIDIKKFLRYSKLTIYTLVENCLHSLSAEAGLVDDFNKLKINIKSEYHNINDNNLHRNTSNHNS